MESDILKMDEIRYCYSYCIFADAEKLPLQAAKVMVSTEKMNALGKISKGNHGICKLWDLLGHFNEKDTVDSNKYHFFYQAILYCFTHMQQLCNLCPNCVIQNITRQQSSYA